MISVPSIKRIARRVVSAVLAAAMLCTGVVAYADEPYTGYNYDWWGDPVPSQNGYVVDKVVSGLDIGCGQFTNPADLYFDDNENLYIADSGYTGNYDTKSQRGRIVVTDRDFNLVNTIEYLDFSDKQEWLGEKKSQFDSGSLTEDRYSKETSIYFNTPTGVFVDDDREKRRNAPCLSACDRQR